MYTWPEFTCYFLLAPTGLRAILERAGKLFQQATYNTTRPRDKYATAALPNVGQRSVTKVRQLSPNWGWQLTMHKPIRNLPAGRLTGVSFGGDVAVNGTYTLRQNYVNT